MSYELKQELKLTQRFVMTPQLQLAIKLLQLSRLELEELVRTELQTNPVLEEGTDTENYDESLNLKTGEEKPAEMDWQAYLEEYTDYREVASNFSEEYEEDSLIDNFSVSTNTLREHLLWQLKMLGLSEGEFRIGEFIIGNIDDDGYLRVIERKEGDDTSAHAERTILEIATHTDASAEEVRRVLEIIQQFDPPGVGARNVKECLLIQARALPVRDTLVEEIIENHLDKLAKKNLKAIAKHTGVSIGKVVDAIRIINRCLNPIPGSGFGRGDTQAIVPDIYIYKVGAEYVIVLNEDGLPKLRISPYYMRLLRENGKIPEKARGYIQDKLRSAAWLIKSVHQRQRTIYKVVESIVKFQREFLDKGLEHLKPLVLKDVADDIGVHESTVSRVTSNKYVQTPRGLFELKFFFSTGINRSDGSNVAVEYIKEKIRDIIKLEDTKTPFSDQQIVEILKKQGIVLARRTVTKYRESLGFLPANRRKVQF